MTKPSRGAKLPPASRSPKPNALTNAHIREAFFAAPSVAQLTFAYALTADASTPFTYWSLTVTTDPDGHVQLDACRSYAKDNETAFRLTADMDRTELRALARALEILADGLGEETAADVWQEYHA